MNCLKVPYFSLDGKETGSIDLPFVFQTPFRPDVIQRAYVALATHALQPQGRDPTAGMKTSAEAFNPPTGRGIARLARVKGEGYARAGQAAGVASVVKGRQAHPPQVEKRVWKYINEKERRLATASAIAATANKELVKIRGHEVDEVPSLPLVVADDVQSIVKAKDLKSVFQNLGVLKDLERARSKKILAGKSRTRGRATKYRVGPLLVIAQDLGLKKAVESLPGVECVLAKDLSVLNLAPGSHPGRLTIWSKSAVTGLSPSLMAVGDRNAG